MKPTKNQMARIAYYASKIGQNANAVYWLECEGSYSEHLRKSVRDNLGSIADIFGLELVEAEPDDDDEPEPPTHDEALATKCDAEAREWEARKLKGMV